MKRLLLLALVACGGPQVAEHGGGVDLTRLMPATLEAAHPREGDPRQVDVRVWADAGIRALPHWKEHITDEIDYAGQLLAPLLGVRLTVAKIEAWDRTGDVTGALDALARVDDGEGVTWVIGYVTPSAAVHAQMAELGDAELLGRHVIVRGWPEQAEVDRLAAKLPDLAPEQRAEVITAYRRHKEAVVLLHMLGETLGAIGETDPSWIGHPAYSPQQSTFSDRDRELMQLALDGRLAEHARAKIAHDLLENIEARDWGGWIANDRDATIKRLRNVIDAARLGKVAADVPVAAYDQFDRVRELRKRGNVGEALIELDNLLTAYPGNATMVELKCELLIGKAGVTAADTRATCARVSELAPGDPSPHLAVGAALAKARDLAGARAELAKAEAKIGNLPAGREAAWRALIAIYQRMGALTWADAAITAAGLAGDPVAQEVAQDRARYGIPRGTKIVAPAGEPALVEAVRAALDLIYAGKYPQAARALATAERRWRGAAGLAAAHCDLELRLGRPDAARAQCRRALARDPHESWALYLSGMIELRQTSRAATRAGIAKLEQAIAVDPALGQAYRALGKAYARVHDRAALDALGRTYSAKFGQPLPP